MVVEDFGVATSKNEAAPMVRDVDVAASLIQIYAAEANIFLGKSGKLRDTHDVSHGTNSYTNCTSSCTKRTKIVETIHNSTIAQSLTENISTSVQNLQICTAIQDPVHHSKEKIFSTDVDSTRVKRNCVKFHSRYQCSCYFNRKFFDSN